MKKTPSYKVLLSTSRLGAVRSESLTKDVNEILDTVAKEDKLVALSRQRSDDTYPEETNAENLLQILRKSLNPAS
jgi:hypothetical protein